MKPSQPCAVHGSGPGRRKLSQSRLKHDTFWRGIRAGVWERDRHRVTVVVEIHRPCSTRVGQPGAAAQTNTVTGQSRLDSWIIAVTNLAPHGATTDCSRAIAACKIIKKNWRMTESES